MEADGISDEEFFRIVQDSGARALLIGRRALVLLGAPVLTADYALWLHSDDIERLNRAFEAKAHFANRSADEARQVGRYVIENGERIDVIVAKAASIPDRVEITFDGMWQRRQTIPLLPDLELLGATALARRFRGAGVRRPRELGGVGVRRCERTWSGSSGATRRRSRVSSTPGGNFAKPWHTRAWLAHRASQRGSVAAKLIVE